MMIELGGPPQLLELTRDLVKDLRLPSHAKRDGYVFLAALIVASRVIGIPFTLSAVSRASAAVGVRVSPRRLALVVAEVSSLLRLGGHSARVQKHIAAVIAALRRDPTLQRTLSEYFGPCWDVALDRLQVKSVELYNLVRDEIRLELVGKSPPVTAAAVVWLSARTLGLRPLTQEVIARAAGISPSALRRRARTVRRSLEACGHAR